MNLRMFSNQLLNIRGLSDGGGSKSLKYFIKCTNPRLND